MTGITAAIGFVLAAGAIAGPTSLWTRALDSRPEAVATGAALLVLASVLRRSLSPGRTR